MEALFYVLFWVAVGLGIANLVISIQKRRKRRREEKEKIYIDSEDRQFFFSFWLSVQYLPCKAFALVLQRIISSMIMFQ